MKFIVPIKILRAASIASAKMDVRYYLNGIHFTHNRIESSNGHVAYLARGKVEYPEWFTPTSTKYDVIINLDHKIPATTRARNIQYAVFDVEENKTVIVRYMDFYGNQITIGQAELVDSQFPNIPKLVAKARRNEKKLEDSVGINTEYLAMPYQMMKDEKFPIVKFEMFGADTAVICSLYRPLEPCFKETFVIMPARI